MIRGRGLTRRRRSRWRRSRVGCGAAEPPGKQVIVLGFDGMDYRVTRESDGQGADAELSPTRASGSFRPLATSIPPQSPVAWSSFITGMDPGGHGIFDFIHRDPKTMIPFLSTTRTERGPAQPHDRQLAVSAFEPARVELLRDGQPFWDVLEQHGVRTTIIRMPANFPPSGSATPRAERHGDAGHPRHLWHVFVLLVGAGSLGTENSLRRSRVSTVDVVDNVVRARAGRPG